MDLIKFRSLDYENAKLTLLPSFGRTYYTCTFARLQIVPIIERTFTEFPDDCTTLAANAINCNNRTNNFATISVIEVINKFNDRKKRMSKNYYFSFLLNFFHKFTKFPVHCEINAATFINCNNQIMNKFK